MTVKPIAFLLFATLIAGSCKNKAPRSNSVEVVIPPPMNEYPKGYLPDSNDVYTVIKFDSKKMRNVFPASYKPCEITSVDMKTIDSLVIISVNDHNAECIKRGWKRMNALKEYRRQLVVAVDINGIKQVYINAFTGWPAFENSWKKNLSYVNDGGSGFFHLNVDLRKKKYYNFGVNGVA